MKLFSPKNNGEEFLKPLLLLSPLVHQLSWPLQRGHFLGKKKFMMTVVSLSCCLAASASSFAPLSIHHTGMAFTVFLLYTSIVIQSLAHFPSVITVRARETRWRRNQRRNAR